MWCVLRCVCVLVIHVLWVGDCTHGIVSCIIVCWIYTLVYWYVQPIHLYHCVVDLYANPPPPILPHTNPLPTHRECTSTGRKLREQLLHQYCSQCRYTIPIQQQHRRGGCGCCGCGGCCGWEGGKVQEAVSVTVDTCTTVCEYGLCVYTCSNLCVCVCENILLTHIVGM